MQNTKERKKGKFCLISTDRSSVELHVGARWQAVQSTLILFQCRHRRASCITHMVMRLYVLSTLNFCLSKHFISPDFAYPRIRDHFPNHCHGKIRILHFVLFPDSDVFSMVPLLCMAKIIIESFRAGLNLICLNLQMHTHTHTKTDTHRSHATYVVRVYAEYILFERKMYILCAYEMSWFY